jgi:hypothetical protein
MSNSGNTLHHQKDQIPVVSPRPRSDETSIADISSSELLCPMCNSIDWANLSTTSSDVLGGLSIPGHGGRVLRSFTASRDQLLVSSRRICRLVGHLKDPNPCLPRYRLYARVELASTIVVVKCLAETK